MQMLSNYSEFLIENEFQSIIDDIFKLVESDGIWTGPNTIEWDMESAPSKLDNLLKKLSKEQIKIYFIKLMNKLKNLPDTLRRHLIITYTSIFLAFVSIGYLVSSPINNISSKHEKVASLDQGITKEILKLNRKSNFNEAQKLVKVVEAGYSDDRADNGNWINTKKGKKFIGSKYGISAKILAEYLGRVPRKEDMLNLSYQTALKIYKNNYWSAQNLSNFSNQYVSNIIYDGCVNQGIEGMKSVLRNALIDNKVKIGESDNPFNKKWITKANTLNQSTLFNSIKKHREDRYKNSVTFKKHGKGWLNRLDNITYKEDGISTNNIV